MAGYIKDRQTDNLTEKQTTEQRMDGQMGEWADGHCQMD